MTDEEIFRDRTANAYFEYCDRYRGVLIRFANERLNNMTDAEDVAQSTLTIVWMKDRLEIEGTVKNYLLAVATRRIYDILRWRDKQKKFLDGTPQTQSAPPTAPFFNPLVSAVLQHGLDALPREQRAALRAYSEQPDDRAAAHTLGMTTQQYKKRVCEALKTLRKKFKL